MRKTKRQIPDDLVFKDRATEAAFWEKNFAQAWADGRPVKVRFAQNLSETINIRLDPKILEKVRVQASQKGLGVTQLIRMWIMEKIGRRNLAQPVV